jgi:hypothetical protein
MELAVPGFKSINPVQVPSWTAASDILSFCREHLLYFQLQSKHNTFFSSRTQTNIFLRNIQQSKYTDVITTLQSHVNAYICEDDDGYLPTNLCINGIATAIHMNAANCVRDVAPGLPCVSCAFDDTGYESWAPSDFFNNVASHCVRSRATCPRSIVWTRVGTTFVPHQVADLMIGMVLLVVAAVAMVTRLLVIGTVVTMVVTVAAHLLMILQSARTKTVVVFSRTFNVMHASGLGMLPLIVTCWLWCSFLTSMSGSPYLMRTSTRWSRPGCISIRINWAYPSAHHLKS